MCVQIHTVKGPGPGTGYIVHFSAWRRMPVVQLMKTNVEGWRRSSGLEITTVSGEVIICLTRGGDIAQGVFVDERATLPLEELRSTTTALSSRAALSSVPKKKSGNQ